MLNIWCSFGVQSGQTLGKRSKVAQPEARPCTLVACSPLPSTLLLMSSKCTSSPPTLCISFAVLIRNVIAATMVVQRQARAAQLPRVAVECFESTGACKWRARLSTSAKNAKIEDKLLRIMPSWTEAAMCTLPARWTASFAGQQSDGAPTTSAHPSHMVGRSAMTASAHLLTRKPLPGKLPLPAGMLKQGRYICHKRHHRRRCRGGCTGAGSGGRCFTRLASQPSRTHAHVAPATRPPR